jgi:hypothetical protein
MSYINNKKLFTGAVSLLLLFMFMLPIFTNAALVPCGNPTQPPCDFNYFVLMINGIINWIIGIAGVIFTISAIYGGFLYMTSGENPGNKAKAKTILWSTLLGFVIILTAWLIVYTILTYVVPSDSDIFRFIK